MRGDLLGQPLNNTDFHGLAANNRSPCRLFAWLTILPVAVCGCSTVPAYAPVPGSVTYKGDPLAGALVVFTPELNAARATPATATDGSFRLQTSLPNGVTRFGAVPGNYKVTVSKFVPPQGMTEEEFAKKVAAAGKVFTHPPELPRRWNLCPAITPLSRKPVSRRP